MKLKRLSLCGILTSAALAIFVLEAQLPPLVPIPGVKLGLSNLITLFALFYLSPKEASGILFARILLGCLLLGNPILLLYSASAGFVCLLIEFCLFRLKVSQIWAISALGALAHNFTQLLTASLITQTASVWWYLPFLAFSGILTGLFTGFCVHYLDRKYGKTLRRFFL